MIRKPLIPVLLFVFVSSASLLGPGPLPSPQGVHALPPAGTDELGVSGQVSVLSRLGGETISLSGTATIERGDPFLDGGVEVVNARIIDLDLQGTSQLGAVAVGMPTSMGPVGPAGQAADTGGDGNGFESNPGGAFSDRTGQATDVNSGTSTSLSCDDAGKDRHRFSNFALNPPPSAAIAGLTVRLDAWTDSTAGSPFMCVELSWDGGNTWTAPKATGPLSTFQSTQLLGSPSDTWGHSWSPEDLSNANFVARITNVASDNQRDFSLDYVAVSLSYSAPSPGEIRSLQPPPDQFPASSFFDLFLRVSMPASPLGSMDLHNDIPVRLTPQDSGQEINLNAWPPAGITYELEPLLGVDNDGDTAIDEDGPDEDGDGIIDEDSPGPDPISPGSSLTCRDDADCDALDGEDPRLDACTLAVCDDDDDGQIDEDPYCVPLLNTHNRHEKAGICITNVSMVLSGETPEQPTYSVAAGGPSGLHPADLLALTPGGSGGSPSVTPVSGNDDFADAWAIGSLPFAGQQSTAGMTTEPGEPLNPGGCVTAGPGKGATVWYRFTAATSGTVDADTFGSGFDTVLAAYTGSTIGALTLLDCNDDTGGLQSQIGFAVTAGTTYRIQVGGFDGFASPPATGSLRLNVTSSGGGDGLGPPFVNIPCSELALSADGCDDGGDGDQDDIDALSFGADFSGGVAPLAFSVAPGSAGLPGTAVADQAACSPAQPQADEFATSLDGTNSLVFDGDGQNGTCPTSFPFGLVEVPTSDDLNALNEQPPSFVDTDGDGAPEEAVFFSLAAGSPTLTQRGRSPADIMWALEGFQPVLYASAAALGLQAGDDIDALCLADGGDAMYNPLEDTVLFSLADGSPTLATLGASAADVLAPGPELRISADEVGLSTTDDLDAIKCGPELLPPPPPTATPTATATATVTPAASPTARVTPTGTGVAGTPTATPFGGPGGIRAPDTGGWATMRGPLGWAVIAGAMGLAGVWLFRRGLPRLRRR